MKGLVLAVAALGATLAAHAAPAQAHMGDGVSLRNDRVIITGTAGADKVALRLVADRSRLEVDVGDDGSAEHRFRARRIDWVEITGGDGDDYVHLDGQLEPWWIITSDGGAGDDTLRQSGTSDDFERLQTVTDGLGQARVSLWSTDAYADATERIELHGRGGGDEIGVFDLTDTDVAEVEAGAGGADGAFDRIIAGGTGGADAIEVVGAAGSATVVGTPALVRVKNAETSDRLDVLSATGDDVVTATTLPAESLALKVDGGHGDDAIAGGAGADELHGNLGEDVVDGNRGADTALLGGSDDTFVWDPGDGSDAVDGQSGTDAMTFNGSGAAELMAAVADGTGATFTRDVGSIVMDLASVEGIDVAAGGGADSVSVGDLSGSATRRIAADLGAGAADAVSVAGTSGIDAITVAGGAGTATIGGLPAATTVTSAEPTDTLAIDTGAGADSVDSSGLAPNTIALTVS